MLTKLGFRSLLVNGKRQGPLDVVYRGTRHAFEVKAVTTNSTEFKAKPKHKEIEQKWLYAKKHGYRPGTLLVVVDHKNKKAMVYMREGLGAFRLGPNAQKQGWHFLGTSEV